jgi:hypothetical protein
MATPGLSPTSSQGGFYQDKTSAWLAGRRIDDAAQFEQVSDEIVREHPRQDYRDRADSAIARCHAGASLGRPSIWPSVTRIRIASRYGARYTLSAIDCTILASRLSRRLSAGRSLGRYRKLGTWPLRDRSESKRAIGSKLRRIDCFPSNIYSYNLKEDRAGSVSD